MRRVAFAFLFSLVGCEGGSEAPPPLPSSSSSSGGSSSGAQCEATCIDLAHVGFEEANTGDRLVGARVVACRGTACAGGVLLKNATTNMYALELRSTDDSGATEVFGSVRTGATAGTLYFDMRWSVRAPTEGETFTVTATSAEAGSTELFRRTFTAMYREEVVCGTRCKVYESL